MNLCQKKIFQGKRFYGIIQKIKAFLFIITYLFFSIHSVGVILYSALKAA